MRVLFINHCYEQDIDSLIAAAPSHYRFAVVPAAHWGTPARRTFPAPVFSSLADYWKPEYAGARERWARHARSLLWDIYHQFQFDVVVAPSDVFFYLFDVVAEAKRMGIPFIVAQKETTITDHTMREHAEQVRKWAPPTADFMTVCSERHKQFWLRAGYDADRIAVTGQPRFDLYAEMRDAHAQANAADRARRTILFLSYELNAYASLTVDGAADPRAPWRALHADTLDVLYGVAAQRQATLIIKPHPQQDRAHIAVLQEEMAARSRRAAAPLGRVAEPDEDTRRLICAADTVVGFQTTALFEAVAARKRTIYTGWSDAFHTAREILIPFHEWGHFICVARSPQELRAAVEAAPVPPGDGWLQAYTEFLGPVDGGACRRTWEVVERVLRAHAARREACAPYRSALAEQRDWWIARERRRARRGALLLTPAAYLPSRVPGVRRLKLARSRWQQRLAELTDSPGSTQAPARAIDGRSFSPVHAYVERVVRTMTGVW
jgi:hypothetical protein